MGKSLLVAIETIANQKMVDKELIFQAMEEALALATCKDLGINENADIRVEIDRKLGDFRTYRTWEVVGEDFEILDENYHKQIFIDVAKEKGYDVDVSETIIQKINSVKFGRIAAQAAKDIIYKKLKMAELKKVANFYADKIGQIQKGTVRKVVYDKEKNRFDPKIKGFLIDLDNDVIAFLPKQYALQNEFLKKGDVIRASLIEILDEENNYELILSRTSEEMIKGLFALEVPEINEGLIEIMAISRDPGLRCKVAVKTVDKRIDPIGSCVGIRGSRVQHIIKELKDEKIDIVLWDKDPAQFTINALSPAEIIHITQDNENQEMEVTVKNEQSSMVIGTKGQNVILASKLVGWRINILSENEANESNEKKFKKSLVSFIDDLDIDENIAEILVEEGYENLNDIAYAELEQLETIEDFNSDIVKELQERAKLSLVSKAMSNKKQPSEGLLNMEGMTEELAEILSDNDIINLEDLAGLATDELQDIVDISDDDANILILTAREDCKWI